MLLKACSTFLVASALFFITPLSFAQDSNDSNEDSGSDFKSLTSPKDLTKDQLDSCASNLCLGETGKDLVECESPLKKLKDMKPKKRPKFLALCPK